VFGVDKALALTDSEYDVDVNLGVGISHGRNMPLLRSLENIIWPAFYKDIAPTALGIMAALIAGTPLSCRMNPPILPEALPVFDGLWSVSD